MTSFGRDMPLVLAAQGGDTDAQNELFLRWRPLVIRTIAKAVPKEDPHDYLGHAFELFVRFIKGFDPSRGTSFVTYFSAHLQWLMFSAVWDEGGAAKRPKWRSMRRVSEKVREAAARVTFVKSVEQDADVLGLKDKLVSKCPIDREHRAEAIDEALQILPDQIAEVATLRARGLTFAQIGLVMGCSRGRTQQLWAKAEVVMGQLGEQIEQQS